MPSDIIAAETGHPAPNEGAIPTGLLTFVLLTPPAAWFVQTVANFTLADYGCGHAMQWGWLWPLILALNLGAIILSAAAVAASAGIWRRSRVEARGTPHGLVEVGEGRNRFLAAWGIVGGSIFTLGVVYGTLTIFLVPLCASR